MSERETVQSAVVFINREAEALFDTAAVLYALDGCVAQNCADGLLSADVADNLTRGLRVAMERTSETAARMADKAILWGHLPDLVVAPQEVTA